MEESTAETVSEAALPPPPVESTEPQSDETAEAEPQGATPTGPPATETVEEPVGEVDAAPSEAEHPLQAEAPPHAEPESPLAAAADSANDPVVSQANELPAEDNRDEDAPGPTAVEEPIVDAAPPPVETEATPIASTEPPAEGVTAHEEPQPVAEEYAVEQAAVPQQDNEPAVVVHNEPSKTAEVSEIPSNDAPRDEEAQPYVVTSTPTDLPTKPRRTFATGESPDRPSHQGDEEQPQQASGERWRSTMHPLLSDESSRDIILRFHQQRSFLKRAVEQCADERVFLPPNLAEALRCILVDDAPAAASHGGSASASTITGASSPSRVASGDRSESAAELQQSVTATSYARVKQDLSDLLRERTANRTALTDSESQGGASTVLPTEAHVDLAQHAILHHPHHAASILRQQALRDEERRIVADGGCPPPNLTTADMHAPKQLLDAAFQARRTGNRRREIEILVDYVRRGREGRIILDTATTMRLLRRIGDAHSALQEYVAAEQYYFDWYLIAEKVLDWSECARALTLLGQAAHARGDLRAAEEWLQKAQWRVRNAAAS